MIISVNNCSSSSSIIDSYRRGDDLIHKCAVLLAAVGNKLLLNVDLTLVYLVMQSAAGQVTGCCFFDCLRSLVPHHQRRSTQPSILPGQLN